MKKKLIWLFCLLLCFTSLSYAQTTAIYNRDKPSEVAGWSVFGADDDIDTAAALITELDTTYAQLAAEDTIEVLSNSAADITQSVIIEGIDNTGDRISETIPLNTTAGTTAETSSATFRYIDQIALDKKCAGVVTVRRATGDTFIASVPIGAMEATMVQHFNGEKDTYITNWQASVTSTTGTVIFDLRYYPDDASSLADTVGYKLLDQIVMTNALGTDPRDFPQPIKCPAGGWIAVYGTGGSNDADGSVTVQGYDVNPY